MLAANVGSVYDDGEYENKYMKTNISHWVLRCLVKLLVKDKSTASSINTLLAPVPPPHRNNFDWLQDVGMFLVVVCYVLYVLCLILTPFAVVYLLVKAIL